MRETDKDGPTNAADATRDDGLRESPGDVATAAPEAAPKLTITSATRTARNLNPALAEETVALTPGTAIGRYLILECVGEGGMGVVYKAYDPDLNRQIALKLVRVAHAARRDDEVLRGRLLREAQGLAQLSHPNVVAIHDVGLFEDSVFLAMELVTGPTLRAWLKTGPSYRHKLQTFIAAGEGLAAAHRADLIHRDFKPANVLIGDDGRPRVVDFGLVRAIDATPESPSGDEHSHARVESSDSCDSLGASASGSQLGLSDPLSTPLTIAGAVMGTPRYMSPEQCCGLEVDERSDQFSFCVTLWEALYGRAPFHGRSRRALREAIFTGKLRPPPSGVRIPAHVKHALLQGLATAPAQRHRSMAALLSELRRDPAKRRRQAALLLTFIALAVAVVLGLTRSRSTATDRCQGGEARLAGVWDDSVGDSIRDTFVASGSNHALPTYHLLATVLDGRADRWRAMYREACEATWVHGEQSQALLDLRMGCLDRNLQATRALIDVFETADAKVVNNAIRAAHGLPAIDDCANVDALTTAVPLPSDPQARKHIEMIERELDHIRALAHAGKPRAALARIELTTSEAEQTGYRPTIGRASLVLAQVRSTAGDVPGAATALTEAITAASASRDHLTAARAAARLIMVIGDQQGKYDLALELRPLAEAIIALAGDPPMVRANLANNIGSVHMRQGNNAEALAAYERALEFHRQALGDDHPTIAQDLGRIAATRALQSEYVGAGRDHLRSLELMRRVLGEDHPRIAVELNNYGIVLRMQGKLTQAQATLERALEIFRAAYGSDTPRAASPLCNLAFVLQDQGELDDAIRVFREVLTLELEHYADDNPRIGETRMYLGSALLQQREYQEARSQLERALAILEKASSRPTLVADTMMELGLITAKTAGCGRALPQLEATLAFARSSVPEGNVTIAGILLEVGKCQIVAGKTRQARLSLEESLATYQSAAPGNLTIPAVQLALAGTLWADKQSRKRAINLAVDARATVSASEAPSADMLGEIDRWLRRHRVANPP